MIGTALSCPIHHIWSANTSIGSSFAVAIWSVIRFVEQAQPWLKQKKMGFLVWGVMPTRLPFWSLASKQIGHWIPIFCHLSSVESSPKPKSK